MHRSEQRGALRGNWILLSLLVVVVAILGATAFGGESATTAGQRFLVALAKADADTLTDMSYFNPSPSKEEIRKMWVKSLEVGKYYRFIWKIKSQSSPTPGRSSVQMDFTRDADKGNAYTENFSLDLLQVDGKWKVDIRGLSREMYPAMPR